MPTDGEIATHDTFESGRGLVVLIASHRNPGQVARLAYRIRRDLPAAALVIHHDQSKSRLERDRLPPGADLVEDFVTGRWGDASLVTLATRCLERIARTRPGFRYVVFLSGQDYPIRNLRGLPAALAALGDGFLETERPEHAEPLRYRLAWFALPDALQTRAVSRLFDRLMFHLNGRQSFVRFANGRIGCRVGIRLKSPFPRGWTIVQGSQWWTLSARAVDTFLSYARAPRGPYRWFVTRTIIPDEAVFQTLLLNSPELHFGVTDPRYIRWDDRRSGSPATLGRGDLPALRASGRWFARKFDADADAAVLDALDAEAAVP